MSPQESTGIEYSSNDIHEGNLLTSIWRRPTATLSYILSHCSDKHVMVLILLGGIARAVDRASQQDSGDKMSTAAILLMAVSIGSISGVLTSYLYAWGMEIAGRWLGGTADQYGFRTVLAWAMVPSMAALALIVPQAFLFGDELFKSEPTDESFLLSSFRLGFGLLDLTFAIWSFVILLQGVRLLQGFSAGRALANIVLPGSLVIMVIILIAGVVKVISG